MWERDYKSKPILRLGERGALRSIYNSKPIRLLFVCFQLFGGLLRPSRVLRSA